MRAGLSVIHVALTIFINSSWLRILSDSLTSLQAIQHEIYHPNNSDYRHRGPLIKTMLASFLKRGNCGLPTIILKVRVHTKVIGNELADSAGQRAVQSFPSFPSH
jgi:hypothetical protein